MEFLPNVQKVVISPAQEARDINPDTHLVLSFVSPPTIGTSGIITVHDVETGRIVDSLNLSIPSSPSPFGNGSTKANYTDTRTYQTNKVGGLDFYYFPIIVSDSVATIYLHNNRLEYNRTYAVVADPGVLTTLSRGNNSDTAWPFPWRFTTKAQGPAAGSSEVTVAADGSADFNTVQGALDWAPSNSKTYTTIHIRDGEYKELVFFQYKSKLILRGQSRNKTIVGYPNNSAFNPPNRQGSSRRPAFSFRGVADLQLSGFTIMNYYRGQAEALLIDGMRVVVDQMNLNGSGDALTTYGTAYIADTTLWGDGDTILGYGSVFWNHSTIITKSGPVSWTRTPQGVHGNVILNCTIISERGGSTFARLPENTGGVAPNWPFAEMVLLNTKTDGISSVGWGPVQGPPFDASNVRFWEFNTMNLDGGSVDYTQRLNVSMQLMSPSDDRLVSLYSDPVFVLGGWKPIVH
ncbi:carbohydrate esterase family 8 protein [Plenodomus tracheiphilus IPT5]|uniref:pectinesterase n=1 Tax=Plenodomus tracheiphilus IPT5 TaxID=1408161 RepID=A0A6A7B3B6_9PLEO|nr:carbohydrate esterase family 8 protein [Plenodomus tracheiphilus IPT5]